MSRKQSTGKRQQAPAIRRSEVEAEIAAKISKAKAASEEGASSNGDESKPRTPPIVGEISNNQITVTAEPWVSPEEVRRKYESLRKIWFWKQTPSERRIELLDFVAKLSEGYYNKESNRVGLRPRMGRRQLMERWNQRYPPGHEWHYTDVRNFSRDVRETLEALTRYRDF